MDDVWADFRFLQDGQTASWSVAEDKGWWILGLLDSSGSLVDGTNIRCATIPVMLSSYPAELAWDAVLEFQDRLRERRVPKFIDSPDALMSFCVKAAVRQR